MLELRPNCECCDVDLPFDAPAMICSYECTFCVACVTDRLHGVCPNCGGGFVPRPVRPAGKLEKDPASTARVTRLVPCPSTPSRFALWWQVVHIGRAPRDATTHVFGSEARE